MIIPMQMFVWVQAFPYQKKDHSSEYIIHALYHFFYRTTHRAKNEEVFKSWHVCYHGTDPDTIGGIVNLGRLVKPG